MGRGANWSEAEVTRVRDLRLSGMTYAEISRMFPHRTPVAIKDAICRWQPIDPPQKDGSAPIGVTHEDLRFQEGAINGSARLLAEIERVFGQRRLAA